MVPSSSRTTTVIRVGDRPNFSSRATAAKTASPDPLTTTSSDREE
jgi:hypothetical protein